MKKHLSLIIACLLIAACVLTACGTPEENFKKATQNFDNFTVEIEVDLGGEKTYNYIGIKAGNLLKVIDTYMDTYMCDTTISYIKQLDDEYYFYNFINKKWNSKGDSREDLALNTGYDMFYDSEVIGVLKQSFFDDYTTSNDEYTMKESALDSYSNYFFGSLESFKFKLSGDHFERAVAITLDRFNRRCQYTCKFKDFGKSRVDIK